MRAIVLPPEPYAGDPLVNKAGIAGCGGPRSGVCINSLPFDECPDVISISVADEEEQVPPEQAAKPPVSESVTTPGGRSLDTAACDALLRERGGTLIGIRLNV